MDVQISLFETAPELFSTADAELRDVLSLASHGWESSKLRIYAAEQLLDEERFISFLAEEFGISGHSIPGGFVDFRGYGIEIRHWNSDGRTRWNWRKAAKIYHALVAEGWPGEKVISLYREARKAGKGAPAPGMYYWGGGRE